MRWWRNNKSIDITRTKPTLPYIEKDDWIMEVIWHGTINCIHVGSIDY